MTNAEHYYSHNDDFDDELIHFYRLFSKKMQDVERDDVNSGLYVVDTLEASVWCLLNNDNYKDTVLCAVNLGGDTDTTASVCGGLAGLYYGLDSIPTNWLKELVRYNYLEMIMDKFVMEVEDLW